MDKESMHALMLNAFEELSKRVAVVTQNGGFQQNQAQDEHLLPTIDDTQPLPLPQGQGYLNNLYDENLFNINDFLDIPEDSNYATPLREMAPQSIRRAGVESDLEPDEGLFSLAVDPISYTAMSVPETLSSAPIFGEASEQVSERASTEVHGIQADFPSTTTAGLAGAAATGSSERASDESVNQHDDKNKTISEVGYSQADQTSMPTHGRCPTKGSPLGLNSPIAYSRFTDDKENSRRRRKETVFIWTCVRALLSFS